MLYKHTLNLFALDNRGVSSVGYHLLHPYAPNKTYGKGLSRTDTPLGLSHILHLPVSLMEFFNAFLFFNSFSKTLQPDVILESTEKY